MIPAPAQRFVRTLLLATVHRRRAREVRTQEQMRAGDVREAWRRSLEQAVAFANRMVVESPGFRERLTRDGIASPITAESWGTWR